MKIISEHKKAKGRMNPRGGFIPAVPIPKGFKRVMAIVWENGRQVTRHIDIEK